ncbi:RNA polymerase sigma-70 factor [Pedobacter sp. ISL-68]|uniref:RNA polymerase sigma factor n=1 Tax=unclassified Pedobacter TaxID=2628915 RepID=UPI001BE7C42B|nr:MULTISPECIES: RNA polymerase sigma-70 factor [unclassified Pedobacter]MBT2560763.1 RNA polymerase sigma-70 factor [Pedobacter sp. ISL-64]MBT2590142.1 RNA polymerase sigma-70 factor [Pedobacter sp. ISL-68]
MDNSLFSSLQLGDHRAMEEIYQTYWENVFDAAFKKTGDEALAQDITQEIFISLWENRTAISLTGSLGAYLYGAVKYKVINYFRSGSIKEYHQTALKALMDEQHIAAADDKLILKELHLEVDAAIALLPVKMQLVFSMSRKQEKSIKEIALELDVSVQTVKNQISAALKLLKKSLSYILLIAALIGLT